MKYKISFYAVWAIICLFFTAFYPIKMCITFLLYCWEIPKVTWQEIKIATQRLKGELLFRLPQEYRKVLKLPDSWGLYHNLKYLNNLKISDVLKLPETELVEFADVRHRDSKKRNNQPFRMARVIWFHTVENEAYNFLGAKYINEYFERLDEEGFSYALAKLDELKFFENYPMPTNVTEIGCIAYEKLFGVNYFEKTVANKILTSWRERSAELT